MLRRFIGIPWSPVVGFKRLELLKWMSLKLIIFVLHHWERAMPLISLYADIPTIIRKIRVV
jgi:hypothetical protein